MTRTFVRATAVALFGLMVAAGLWTPPAQADSLARDPVNGATVLFPYFEVDLDDPEGSTTVLSVRNASATAVLVNFTVWSDLGIPLLNFPAYFTGYDVVNLDMRAMLVDGQLPITASDGQDWSDDISPQGMFSQDINFASCTGIFPFQAPELLPYTIEYLQDALTGQPAAQLLGQCAGFDHGDRIARGYITVDTTNNCTQRKPGQPGYFIAGGQGDATNQNVISGDYLLRGNGGRLLHSGRGATLEASTVNHNTPGSYTFYGRNVAWTAADNREPLNGAWAVDTQARGSEFIVWRDTKQSNPAPFDCSLSAPFPMPLGQSELVNFATDTDFASGAVAPFPLATQRLRLGGSSLPGASGKPGWSYLNLNTTVAGNPNPPIAPQAAQALVEVIQFPESAAQGGGAAAALSLDTGNEPRPGLDLPPPNPR